MEITRFNTASAIALYRSFQNSPIDSLKISTARLIPLIKKLIHSIKTISFGNKYFLPNASFTKGFSSSSKQTPAKPNSQYPIKNRLSKIRPIFSFFSLRDTKISDTCRKSLKHSSHDRMHRCNDQIIIGINPCTDNSHKTWDQQIICIIYYYITNFMHQHCLYIP